MAFDKDRLTELAIGNDPQLAKAARQLLAKLDEAHIKEPQHCAECYEGCAKCNWGKS